ncbi:ABC transporter ATP-binding protein [Frankia sp. AgB1.9]|uniref:ATP-binding cassette domain-containing protein n=1 Tax=unclassified Frankia TaxID=2632575 RepID=UPI0019347C85|nr:MULTISPECIES: ABC transporter ATP-binding protein [unclassified Frankia]MBL7492620.1 ABC transporter ATP-binding protein [Frankia sp. AgW1.1]MBL7549323.1 ABC transporter ATP-binding protein [Frankia sp. AgB1.9]MBL7619210.1 ABC transporter ATP-binding protein [Frankia sp. AgB1.8]
MKPRAIDRDIEPFLRVRNLRASVAAPRHRPEFGERELVRGIDLDVWPGERVALVGESGSGKSVTARGILQLDPSIRLTGSVEVARQQLIGAAPNTVRGIRGRVASMVFQDPMTALNPVLTVGDQVAEPLRLAGTSRKEAMRQAADMLDRLGVPNARARLGAYPQEFSGGMRQRVVLAAALIGQPSLLIADEPTTALDVLMQEQILDLIVRQSDDLRLAVLLITHDLGLVAGATDRVYVMRSGEIVEEALVDDLFAHPEHPYTRALLGAVPTLDHDPEIPLTPVPAAGAEPEQFLPRSRR